MSYSTITFKDRNPVKRFLQNKRLRVALSALGNNTPAAICDFGAGNGELLKNIPTENITLTCYEPSSILMDEAKANLTGVKNVVFTQHVGEIPSASMDYVFCLEVFEHLPEAETTAAINDILRILKDDGVLVMGVPVEIGIPAVYKGLFRLTRRRNTFDTHIGNILSATFSSPPKNRPVGEIAPGFNFHYEHMGFDYRALKKRLNNHFTVVKTLHSPYSLMSPIMPEIYYIARPKRP